MFYSGLGPNVKFCFIFLGRIVMFCFRFTLAPHISFPKRTLTWRLLLRSGLFFIGFFQIIVLIRLFWSSFRPGIGILFQIWSWTWYFMLEWTWNSFFVPWVDMVLIFCFWTGPDLIFCSVNGPGRAFFSENRPDPNTLFQKWTWFLHLPRFLPASSMNS